MQVSKSPIIIASRGARFLDLVLQNKLNVSPQLSKARRFSLNSMPKQLNERDAETQKLGCFSEKLKKEKEYLRFNSNLTPFHPDASPSSSILSKNKRKAEADSSPCSSVKRKRVGFRDPVSSTKEYLVTDEEERQKQNSLSRCLSYENDEIEDEELTTIRQEVKAEIKVEVETIQEPLLDHDYEIGSPQNTDISTSNDFSDKLSFKNKNELMKYISQNLSVDEIFDQLTQAEEQSLKRKELVAKVVKTVGFNDLLGEYFTVPATQSTKLSPDQNEVITAVLGEVSKLMTTNSSVQHKVLDVLSEQHAKEFLDHALQENSTARVLDKITIDGIVNYLVHKVNTIETDETDAAINKMSRAMLQSLITRTNVNDREVVKDRKETQELMKLLFKNKPKIEIFDTVHEFLRNIVQNH